MVKHHLTRSSLVLAFLALLGVALIVDFLWASSPSSSMMSTHKHHLIVPIQENDTISGNVKVENADEPKRRVSDRELSATFADLPAPELEWEQMPSAPVPRLDGSAIHIKDLLYVFAGFGTLDYVHYHVDVYNFTDNTWGERFNMPKEMANSHLGMASDGRYIYIVSGQHGPQCRTPPIPLTFVLDTDTRKWGNLPPLPAPRACVADSDRLFVIGGQEGDFMPKPGSPIYKCSRRNEVVYADVYMLDANMKWKKLSPMPKPNSHIESSWVIINNSIVIVGGTTEKHPVNKRMVLVGEVFQFHLDTLEWSVIGKLPYRVKTALASFWEGRLYFTSGQRDRGPDNPQPKRVLGEMWRTKLSL